MVDEMNLDNLVAEQGRSSLQTDAPETEQAGEAHFWESWAKSSKTEAQHDQAPFPDAVARIYIRRDASPEAITEIRSHLERFAKGRFGFTPFYTWTALDVEHKEDLLAIRAAFSAYIDGWRELS